MSAQNSTTMNNTVVEEATHVLNDGKLLLERLNQKYNQLDTVENILRDELNNLKHEEELLRKALLQCREETGREQMSREKSTKLQDEAWKNLHDVLMGNDSDDEESSSSSSSSSSKSVNRYSLQVDDSSLVLE
jgi:hypothetical protein